MWLLLCGYYSKAPYCVATIVWLLFEGSLLGDYYSKAPYCVILFEGSLLCDYYSKAPYCVAPYCVATIRRLLIVWLLFEGCI